MNREPTLAGVALACVCDLPFGTPHVCAEERQADGPIDFVSLSEYNADPEPTDRLWPPPPEAA